MRRGVLAAPGPVALALVALAACGPEASPRPNLLLVVVDSLRADRLSPYGHRRPTPGFDRLAAEGTTFDAAYASAPWTMPSVATMLTGLHPTEHGVTHTGAALPDDVPTLAEALRAVGYRTHAVISHHLIGRKFGFDRGFDGFDQESARGHRFVSSGQVTQKALAVLDQVARDGAPFFLLAHYFDPHYDYRDHPGIDYAPARAGRLDGSHGIGQLRRMVDDMTTAERRFLLDRYDEEIRLTDAGVEQLVAHLDELGLAERTFVVFTADHGEEFGTRGWIGHTQSLYDELVRVPLVVRGPGVASGRRVAGAVSLVELAPALAQLAGARLAAAQPPGAGGASLVDVLRGAEPSALPRFVEVDYLGAEPGEPGVPTCRKKAVVRDGWKLVRDDRTGQVELYDLGSDPAERSDLAAAEPERAEELARLLDAHLEAVRGRARDGAPVEQDEEELRRLQDLGYVGD